MWPGTKMCCIMHATFAGSIESWNLPSNFPDLEEVLKTEIKSEYFFKSYNKLYKWNKFRFGQIILNLAHTVAARHEKSFDPVFLKSLSITYLINLSLEKRMTKIVLAKKVWKKSWMLYAKICVNPAFDSKTFFKIFKFFYINEKLVMLICHITVSFEVFLNKCNCYCYYLLSPFPHIRLVLVSYIIRVDAELTWTML